MYIFRYFKPVKTKNIRTHTECGYHIDLSLLIFQKYSSPETSVVDPHWFHCVSGSSILGQCWSGSASRIFDHWKLKNIQSGKKKSRFLINWNLLISRLPCWTSKLHEKPSAHIREHPALQNMKFLPFFIFAGHFCPVAFLMRIRIQMTKMNADPDPATLPETVPLKPYSFRRRRWSTRWRATPCPSAPSTSARTRKSSSQVNTARKSQMYHWLIGW